MKIIVCVKQVPDVKDVRIDEESKTLMREGVSSIVNPFDEFALEEALRIRESSGGTVTVITMGPPQAAAALRRCLALGADQAYHLCDRLFAGSDTLATSHVLAEAIRKIGFDLVLCGKQAIDGDTAQVGPEIAEHLGIPHCSYVRRIRLSKVPQKEIIVHSDLGYVVHVIKVCCPVLMTVVKYDNVPALPSIESFFEAKNKPIITWTARELERVLPYCGLEHSPTQVVDIYPPQASREGKLIQNDGEIVPAILNFMRENGIIDEAGR